LTSGEWLCSAELSFSDLGEDSSHTTDRRAFGLHVFIQRNVICAMGAEIPVARTARRLKFALWGLIFVGMEYGTWRDLSLLPRSR